jgi:flagellar biosynthetic protein FliP
MNPDRSSWRRRRPARAGVGRAAAAALLAVTLACGAARGQAPAPGYAPGYAPGNVPGGAPSSNAPVDLSNPISVLDSASRALPGATQALTQALTGNPGADAAPTPPGNPAGAANAPQDDEAPRRPGPVGPGLSASLSILILLTVLTIAPTIVILCTSFTRMVIVLSLLRQALGTQSLPPNQVVVGLAFLLTLLVMAPTIEQINKDAIVPLQNNKIDQMQAWAAAKQPMRDFMFAQIEHAGNQQDIYMLLRYRGVDTSDVRKLERKDVDMIVLVPAFVLSELKVAFMMGFRLYLPFMVIDMVISSVLISMGMLMLPPVLISLPFKLLLFVLVDGWRLVAGSLLASFALPGITT